MKLHFQKAGHEDVNEISALYHAAIGTDGCTWSEDYPNADITKSDWERGDLFCIKSEEDEIVGAIAIDEDLCVDALSCWSSEWKPAAEVARLVVKQEFQNQGIARMLLFEVMEELKSRGFQSARFLVSPGNERALRSYAKLDFTHCGDCDLYDHHWFCYEKKL